MAIYTRQQLRDGVIFDIFNIFPGSVSTISLVNNLPNVAYFNIEGTTYSDPSSPYGGISYRQIFNSASITSLVNCTMVTESMHAGFIVNPSSTATFDFQAVGAIIRSGHMRFIAANPTVLSGSTATVYGIEFTGF
jgi:hypothetical protein